VSAPQPAQPDELDLRSDARITRVRILEAARALVGDRRTSMVQIAAAAQVSRSTLYRHFRDLPSISAAIESEDGRSSVAADAVVAPLPFQAPGRLGSSRPLALEVTHVLDEVPPHLIADQLVAEARRAGGVAIGLYVVDIDGSQLIRLAGSEDFPEFLEAPPALGPEIVPEGLPGYYPRLREILPRCTVIPLWLRGRVLGLLLAVGTPVTPLEDIAKQGAAALELAGDYTDLIERTRRRKPTTAAAEVQYHLLPPRIARVAGAQIAGGLLPTYEVGGDWFDFVENRDGTWIALAEPTGNSGPTAAGLGAAALGALRAARRSGQDLIEAARSMDEVVTELGSASFRVSAILARWHAPTGTLAWLNFGAVDAWIADPEGSLQRLESDPSPPLGAHEAIPDSAVSSLRLDTGDRLIMVTDGVTERRIEGGGTFGEAGVRSAVLSAAAPTAAATAMSIQHAITDCWAEPLEDDATLVVVSID
jgi:serine phosphatase RsbU (regulator of sigma subunit)